MKKTFEQFIKEAKSASLSRAEKEELKARIFSVVDAPEVVKSPYYSRVLVLVKARVLVPVAVMFFVLVGSTGVFAEYSLPGDLLFPLKTAVTEQVRGWLAFSAEAKANWHISLAHRRLDEMDRLSSEGHLTEEVREWAQDSFEVHTLNAEKTLPAINTNTKANMGFEAKISEDSKVLETVALDASTFAFSAAMNTDVHPQISLIYTEKEAERKFKNAKEALERLRERTEAMDDSRESLHAKLALVRAERIFVTGKIRLLLGEYGVAYLMFKDVIDVTENIEEDFGLGDYFRDPKNVTPDNGALTIDEWVEKEVKGASTLDLVDDSDSDRYDDSEENNKEIRETTDREIDREEGNAVNIDLDTGIKLNF